MQTSLDRSIQKRFVWCQVIWLAMAMSPAHCADKTINVCGPTVVAFIKPAANAQEEKEDGYNDALSDFEAYAGLLQQPLKNKGIDFKVVYAAGFRTKCGSHAKTFIPDKITVGYYFIEPGKHPRVEYGVMTNLDLLKVADEYFGRR